MSKTLAKSKLRSPILFICLAFLIPRFGLAEDFLDRLMERCSKGDMQACDELNELTDKHREQIERLNDQADRFGAFFRNRKKKHSKLQKGLSDYIATLYGIGHD